MTNFRLDQNDDKRDYAQIAQDLDEPINQLRIIQRLNGYLEWHHFPIRMGHKGICRGLSTVYAKYVLEGKSNEFKHLLYMIAGDIQPDSEHNNALNHFAVEVALSQSPQHYEKEIRQRNSAQCLEIHGEKLKSSFDFGMDANNENWPDLLTTLNLNHDEALLVSGFNHSVCVTRKNWQYILYDPNYSDGFRSFPDENSLIQELRDRLEDKKAPHTPWAMQINLLRHPVKVREQIFPRLPTTLELYKKYVIDGRMHSAEDLNRHLQFAATYGDEELIQTLIQAGATDFYHPALRAILDGNVQSLAGLLPKIKEQHSSHIPEFFENALLLGSKKTLHLLSIVCKEEYEALFDKRKLRNCIYQAALGGNHDILKKLLAKAKIRLAPGPAAIDTDKHNIIINYDDHLMKSIFSEKRSYMDVMKPAIKVGSAKCIQALIEFGQSSSYALTEEEILELLLIAIRKNQFPAVKYLVTQVSPSAIQHLNMTMQAIDRTELSILLHLKNHGMVFSNAALGVIQQKNHQVVSFYVSLDILLRKFTDYLLQLLRKDHDAGVKADFQKLRLFKKSFPSEKERPNRLPIIYTVRRD